MEYIYPQTSFLDYYALPSPLLSTAEMDTAPHIVSLAGAREGERMFVV